MSDPDGGRASYITGDVRDTLATIPDASVDLVMTSPPFLALRSYLPADHPDKDREIGAEPDPASFLATLLGLTAEFRRVLAPHGSICVELGDTYSGTASVGWPLLKSLCGIPHLYHLSLAYGRNLLTGEPCEPWLVRNVVAWCRPNPPVGAIGDKFRPATSYLTIACVSGSRYFDLDAVRSEGIGSGAPPRDYWEIPTTPYRGSHFAVYPRGLVETPVKSMAPAKVCTVCGEPSRRITEVTQSVVTFGHSSNRDRPGQRLEAKTTHYKGRRQDADDIKAAPSHHQGYVRHAETVGWSDCGHDSWRPGVVLDPFGGSGTTLAVATGHGHHAIGIDIDDRNVDLARDRVGPMFLDAFTLDEWKNR